MTGSRAFLVAVSGASGVIYGVRLISALLERSLDHLGVDQTLIPRWGK
jgi:3-polyprenyl-4-hydroxybenzoate decarboxylase